MDAEKVKLERAQRKADDALMEPARLAARGLTLEQIETDMKRQGMSFDRDYLKRQIEKADRKRAAEEDEPFYAVNTEVSHSDPCSADSADLQANRESGYDTKLLDQTMSQSACQV